MDKYVVMFKGGVETQEYFSIEMSKIFEEHGWKVYWFDLIVSERSTQQLYKFYQNNKGSKFIAFTFNHNGIAGEEGLYDEAFSSFEPSCANFWDYADIHVYNMVVDHPLYYHQYIAIRPKKYTQISIDKNHIKYMQRFFPEVDVRGAAGFVPLGGTELNSDKSVIADAKYIPIKDRKIDVIFTGNYTPPKRFDKYISGMAQEYKDFYYELVDEAIDNPNELIEVLAENKFLREAEEFTQEELKMCMPNMMFVDLSVRFHYRAKVIAALADSGIKVHTFGAGWDLLECRHPENIIKAGSVNSQECLDMISQSKISVNVMPWFKDGAHDRIFNSMLNGAVVLSDTSQYLLEEFSDNKDILFYSLKGRDVGTNIDNIGERVRDILKDNDKMQAIADAGYNRCIGRHTWKERTEQILKMIYD